MPRQLQRLHLDAELLTPSEAALAKLEDVAGARAIDDAPAPVILIQLRGPKGGEKQLALGAAHARHQVQLGEEGPVDRERAPLDGEGRLVNLDVNGETGLGEEAVIGSVSAAKVRVPPVREAEVGILASASTH